jgi:hypothetical protein
MTHRVESRLRLGPNSVSKDLMYTFEYKTSHLRKQHDPSDEAASIHSDVVVLDAQERTVFCRDVDFLSAAVLLQRLVNGRRLRCDSSLLW